MTSYRILRSYIIAAVFTGLFAVIYNRFGHGVQSPYMNFAWVWPAAGCILALIFTLLKRTLPESGRVFLACGIATLTFGFILEGIFEIAGTNSPFIPVFYVAGGVLCGISVPILLSSDHL